MPSPFPGMDPYLEGALWPDVHQRLATAVSSQLTPYLRPRYVARLALTTFYDETPESEIGIMYPDGEVLRRKQPIVAEPYESQANQVAAMAPPITPALIVPLLQLEVRMVTVEIRDSSNNQLVTSIEVLSPANKREPDLTQFRQKRMRLRAAHVHLLEIDLIRRGERPIRLPVGMSTITMGQVAYLVTLARAGADTVEAWPISLNAQLPVVAVLLRPPDADVPLDLAQALATIYDEAAYDHSIDYCQSPPPPDLDDATAAWMHDLLKRFRQGEVQP